MSIYTIDHVAQVSLERLADILRGETHLPVTPELLALVAEFYASSEALQPLMVWPLGGVAATEPVVEWIAAFGETHGDEKIWAAAASDAAASYSRKRTAPAAMMTGHTLQLYVWADSIERGRLWSEAAFAELVRASEASRRAPTTAQRPLGELADAIFERFS